MTRWSRPAPGDDLPAAAEKRAGEALERRQQHHPRPTVGTCLGSGEPTGGQLPYEADRVRHIHLRERRCAEHSEVAVEPSARRTRAALDRGYPRPAAHMLHLIHIPPLGRHQGRGAKTIGPGRSVCNCRSTSTPYSHAPAPARAGPYNAVLRRIGSQETHGRVTWCGPARRQLRFPARDAEIEHEQYSHSSCLRRRGGAASATDRCPAPPSRGVPCASAVPPPRSPWPGRSR